MGTRNANVDSSTFRVRISLRTLKLTGPSSFRSAQDDLRGAMIHFNPFIKLHDYKSVGTECLLLLMSRGVGVLCANNYASVDSINEPGHHPRDMKLEKTTCHFAWSCIVFGPSVSISKRPQGQRPKYVVYIVARDSEHMKTIVYGEDITKT
jgi:hypothetical protein